MRGIDHHGTGAQGAYRLAASNAIGENAYEPVDIAGWAICFVAERYPDLLAKRYDLGETLDEILAGTGCEQLFA